MAQLTADGIVRHRTMAEIIAPAVDPVPEDGKRVAAPIIAVTKADDLPDKYKDKTVAEVAEMHLNAEKELGRVRNEIGTYRGLVSDLSALHRIGPDSKPEVAEPVNVSGDELLADPVKVVESIIKPHLEQTEKATMAAQLQSQAATEGSALMVAYPDLDATIATEDFQRFATRTPSRQTDFSVAASGNGLDQVRAARRLLEDYTDFQDLTKVEKTPEELTAEKLAADPIAAAKAAATLGAGPSGPISSKEQLYEIDVINIINSDPAKYRSPSFQRELTSAILEGRYVKQGT